MDRTSIFGDLIGRYPSWEAWTGVTGTLYARWLKTSPPIVVSAKDPAGLEAEIQAQEARQR